jgi:hypothetical protein
MKFEQRTRHWNFPVALFLLPSLTRGSNQVMTQFLRAYHERATTDATDPSAPLRFVASTEGVKRDGQDLKFTQWSFDNFRANPLCLWVHDYMGEKLPIGRVDLQPDPKTRTIVSNITFDEQDPFAMQVRSKYERGFLNAVSVGWDVVYPEGKAARDVSPEDVILDLLDVSAVPIPGDPSALMMRQKRALASLGREFLALADESPENPAKPTESSTDPATERASWDETSAAMVRTFRPHAQRPDADRKTEYQRLARDYARHGKTPPEFLTQDELDAYDGATLRGLFLEGEPELHAAIFAGMESRAGKQLNARNQSDLEQAHALLGGILERSAKEAANDANTDDERVARLFAESVLNRLKG